MKWGGREERRRVRGTWMAPSVTCPALDLSSAHALGVVRPSPVSGCVLSAESTEDSLSPDPPAPLPCSPLDL